MFHEFEVKLTIHQLDRQHELDLAKPGTVLPRALDFWASEDGKSHNVYHKLRLEFNHPVS